MLEPDRLLHQLHQTARAITKHLNAQFESHGVFGAEWGILSTLKKRGPMCQVDLADYLNIEPAAISRSLLRLEGKRFIRRRSGRDRREKQVCLTETAVALYPRLEAIVAEHHGQVLAGLGEDEKSALLATLTKLFANATTAEKPSAARKAAGPV